MKTIKIFIQAMLLMMMSTGIGLAGNPKTTNSPSECSLSLYKEIRSVVTYPQFAKEQNIQGFVVISFNYDKQGNLKVIGINSNDNRLSDYVLNQMSKANVGSCVLNSEEVYSMRFNFLLK
jgi:hypothetical protein